MHDIGWIRCVRSCANNLLQTKGLSWDNHRFNISVFSNNTLKCPVSNDRSIYPWNSWAKLNSQLIWRNSIWWTSNFDNRHNECYGMEFCLLESSYSCRFWSIVPGCPCKCFLHNFWDTWRFISHSHYQYLWQGIFSANDRPLKSQFPNSSNRSQMPGVRMVNVQH